MYITVGKLIPILALGSLAIHSQQTFTERLASVSDLTKKVITHFELHLLTRQAELHSIGEKDFTIENTENFIRLVTKENAVRDVTKDRWGSSYRFSQSGNNFTFSSAGPDQTWGTDDDLVVRGSF
jgi:hypothetical protein